MGVVYQARHTKMGRKFAVKILTGMQSEDESGWKRFRREAETAARIHHPHVTGVIDYDVSPEGIPYLVMEYVDGGTLQDFIRKHPRIPYAVFLKIMKQIVLGLQSAHKEGIIHRDLKPANIMLDTPDGEPFVKIADFGLARLQEREGGESTLTETGMLIGTPHYLSPEACRGQKIDHRSDLYALGVIAYEMLTGKTPFETTNILEQIRNHIEKDPPPLTTWRPDLPPKVEQIVLKMLSKNPADRYQSATEFMDDLEKVTSDDLATGMIELTEIPQKDVDTLQVDASTFIQTGEVSTLQKKNALQKVVFIAIPLLVLILFAIFRPHEKKSPETNTAVKPASAKQSINLNVAKQIPEEADFVKPFYGDSLPPIQLREETGMLDAPKLFEINSGVVKIRDLQTTEILDRQNVPFEATSLAVVSGASEFAVNDGKDVVFWNYKRSKETGRIPLSDKIVLLTGSPDTPKGAALTESGALYSLDFAHRKALPLGKAPESASGMFLSPQADRVVVWNMSGKIRVYSGKDEDPWLIPYGKGFISRPAIDSQEKYLSFGSNAGELLVYEIQNKRLSQSFKFNGWATSVCWTPDEQFLLAVDGDKSEGRFQSLSGKLSDPFRVDASVIWSSSDPPLMMGYDPDSRNLTKFSYISPQFEKKLAVGSDSIWRIVRGKDGRLWISGKEPVIYSLTPDQPDKVTKLKGHTDGIPSLFATKDGQWLISAGDDRALKLWKLPEGTQQESLQAHDNLVNAIVATADGKHLISTSSDKSVRMWTIPEITFEKKIADLKNAGQTAAVSANGRVAAVGDWIGNFYLFEAPDWTPKHKPLELDTGCIYGLVALPPEQSFLATTLNGNAYLIDGATGDSRLLRHYSRPLYGVDVSPALGLIAILEESQIYLYHLSDFSSAGILAATGFEPSAIAFDEKQPKLYSGDSSGNLWIWNLKGDREIKEMGR